MDFYPASAQPPRKLVNSEFLLRPLRASDVDLDYDAVMENPEALRLSGGGSWPTDDFTLEANLSDLVIHENEHEDRVAFTYTMMNPSQDRCLGCVYINQLTQTYRLVETAESGELNERQAIVRFWVRQSRVQDDLDWRLLKTLLDWLTDAWSFSDVYMRAHEHDERQNGLLKRAGLKRRLTLELPGCRGHFLVYGPLGESQKEDL